jgi:hypothetical protein
VNSVILVEQIYLKIEVADINKCWEFVRTVDTAVCDGTEPSIKAAASSCSRQRKIN